MRSGTIVILALTAAGSLAVTGRGDAQPPAPPAVHQPRTAVFLGGGVRDAGDIGGAQWMVTAGVRRSAGQQSAWTLALLHMRVTETVCPAGAAPDCTPQERATVSGAEVGVEFLYGSFRVQPYGAAAVGAAHLRREADDLSRWGFAYSTGLGLSAQAGPRAWLFGELRWRQESFGSTSVHGPAGVLGVRIGV